MPNDARHVGKLGAQSREGGFGDVRHTVEKADTIEGRADRSAPTEAKASRQGRRGAGHSA
jgi:hypothetical protein